MYRIITNGENFKIQKKFWFLWKDDLNTHRFEYRLGKNFDSYKEASEYIKIEYGIQAFNSLKDNWIVTNK